MDIQSNKAFSVRCRCCKKLTNDFYFFFVGDRVGISECYTCFITLDLA